MRRYSYLSVAFLLLTAPNAWAAIDLTHYDMTINLAAGTGAGSGGPWQMTIWEDTRTYAGANPQQHNNTWVQTTHGNVIDQFYGFCVETGEHISGSTPTYDINKTGTVTDATNYHLSGYAAWVYDAFLAASKNNHRTSLGGLSATDKTAYQNAIWAGMVKEISPGVYGTPTGADTEYRSYLGSNYGTLAGNNLTSETVFKDISYTAFLASNWGGGPATAGSAAEQTKLHTLNGYQLVNLIDNAGNVAQDQFIAIPSDLALVPEPASLVVWSLLAGGAAGLSVVRKRRGLPRGRWSNDSRNAILAVVGAKDHHK